jgi:hypothetical protein
MKKIILISCLAIFSFGMENSEKISMKKVSTWIDPSKKICINSGGRYDKNLCFANFKDAQNICSSMGGKVPSYEDLYKEASLCGGNIEEGEIKNEKFYHSCYRKKGFKGRSYDEGKGGFVYMTSNQTEDKTVIIDFFHVTQFAISLDARSIVRCMK